MRYELLHRIISSVRGYLDIGQAPQRTDCIFVYAGRPERKRYGLQLFLLGYADSIVFSVARYEWRRFSELGVDDGGLRKLVDNTPPAQRHFFVHVTRGATRCFLVRKRKLGTLGEAAAISRFVEERSIRSLLVVSSALHLRRAVRAIEHFSLRSHPALIPVGVPRDWACQHGSRRASSEEDVTAIVKEHVKLLLYRPVLRLRIPL